ncbi:hypothetical protein GLOIN_2v1766738 [Rhizophagus clarus]|uniref:RNase H type-1 domain-containing protein n=1 Tax=Rhizophagus clarus TaxID=94130 RepID=A0A8H3M8R4_9GLOM|nr:hypothetical protein GLOIN_2v1766738 [Rhizophagus clarus]
MSDTGVIKAELIAIIMALLCSDKSIRITICTDSQIIINQFSKINTLSIFAVQRLKLQYSGLAIKELLVTLQKVNAHDSDDHSNVVDKLAKKACSRAYLVIDPKLLAHNGTICWNHKPIERNITLMVKDIKETQYIKQFLMLNKNRYFTLPSDLESFNWSLTFRYIKDKFDDTSAFDSRFNSFKTKLRAEELSTQDNLCKQSPSVYTGNWRCALCNTELETYQYL